MKALQTVAYISGIFISEYFRIFKILNFKMFKGSMYIAKVKV